jgi:hypothetical protein
MVKLTPDKVYTIAAGFVDAVLIAKYPALFIAKNIIIPFSTCSTYIGYQHG